jgi:hypothetical protein
MVGWRDCHSIPIVACKVPIATTEETSHAGHEPEQRGNAESGIAHREGEHGRDYTSSMIRTLIVAALAAGHGFVAGTFYTTTKDSIDHFLLRDNEYLEEQNRLGREMVEVYCARQDEVAIKNRALST